MKTQTLKIADLKEVPEFRSFYSDQSIEDLVTSLKNDNQQVPIQVTEDGFIIDGYRRVDALKANGELEVFAIVRPIIPNLYDRFLLNQYRTKTVSDRIQELKFLFKKFPKRQGTKSPNDEKYVRHEKISAGTNGRYKGDKVIKKLEEVINNDLPNDFLLKGIIENNWGVDTCHEFITETSNIDKVNGYGYTEKLVKGEISVADANKLIKQRENLEKYDETFIIPNKCKSFNIDCIDISQIDEFKNSVDLIFTSPPYWDLRHYDGSKDHQLGHEKTKEEYCENLSQIFNGLIPTLKSSSNVIVNIGESYKDGVGQGIPHLLKSYIERNTTLIYKDTLIWSKMNPRQNGDNVKRPTNSIEYLLWFVMDPNISKYKKLRYKSEDFKPKISHGFKDVDSKGKNSKKSVSCSSGYKSIWNHIKEQEIENIIVTSVGKNHDVYKIYEEGHPAIMSPFLPVVPVLMLTDEGDRVFDPFSGSNVVSRISILLNRVSLSTELSEKYFKIGCRMLEKSVEDFNRTDLSFINSSVLPDFKHDLKIAA